MKQSPWIRAALVCLTAAFLTPAVGAAAPPSVLIVQLDDTRWDGIDRMPELDRFARDAVRFTEAFVTTPVCWASRASLLTGRYARGMGIAGATSQAAKVFRRTEADRQTLATWLRAAGYTTGYFGKYLNGYTFERLGPVYYVPPGWHRWRAFGTSPAYGGPGRDPYTLVHEDGFERSHVEYSTDLLAEELIEFVSEAEAPFLAFWAPLASHVDADRSAPVPAPRHAGMMDDLPDFRPPSYDVVDPDQPEWLTRWRVHGEFRFALTDLYRRRAYETLLAVDEQFAAILRVIPESTIVVVTSDNGVGWGEHGLFFQLKGCPYDECIRVPLIIRAPSLRAGESQRLTLNIDVASIVMDLAGLEIPVPVDGQIARRGKARFEYDETTTAPYAPSWTAVRTKGNLMVEHADGLLELYGLGHDPYQMDPIGVRAGGPPE